MTDPHYPQGKLNEYDEGELTIAIATENDNVVIHFGKPVKWVGMPPDHAIALAELIIARAYEIKDAAR